jgi:hypothetical protein
MVPFLISTAAGAAVLVPVAPVPGSQPASTAPLGISNSGIIDGSYKGADLSLHGFVGKADGPYTTFDAGPGGTEPRAINDLGWITGYSGADNCNPHQDCVEFERSPGGAISAVTKNGAQLFGTVQGINFSGVFVGDYHPAGSPLGQTSGFYGANSQYTSDLTLPFATRETEARSINIGGEVIGWYLVPGDITRGFVLSGGTVSIVNYPDPTETGTDLEGVNDQGEIAGQWFDAASNLHSFVLAPDLVTFTDINVPGATQVQAFGINNKGEVAVSTDIGGFIYCIKGPVGVCHGKKVRPAAASGRRAGSIRAVPCLNDCRFHGATPAVFFSPAGGREPVPAMSSARSKRLPQ